MSAPGVLVDLEKVEALMSWERPKINLRDSSSWDWLGTTRDTRMG